MRIPPASEKTGPAVEVIGYKTVGTHSVDITVRGNPGLSKKFAFHEDDFTVRDGKIVPRIDTAADNNIFALMQPSTKRTENRFADAYIEPEYDALARYNDNDVKSIAHFPDDLSHFVAMDRYRGSKNIETELFWTVYVLAGYEPLAKYSWDPNGTQDSDPWGGGLTPYGPKLPRGFKYLADETSIVFLEALRDYAQNPPGSSAMLDPFVAIARATTHEVGHQFGLVPPK